MRGTIARPGFHWAMLVAIVVLGCGSQEDHEGAAGATDAAFGGSSGSVAQHDAGSLGGSGGSASGGSPSAAEAGATSRDAGIDAGCQSDGCCPDADADGICDAVDFCFGDNSRGDLDDDGVCNGSDLCNGDDVTGDSDSDGVCDDIDACIGEDASGDFDGDGVCSDGDACSGDDATGDSDGDDVCDDVDECLGDDAIGDSDGDAVCDDNDACAGDDAAGDSDGDDVCDDSDACDGDDAIGDFDGDGACDDTDTDDDGDGIADETDLCLGDNATGDADVDGVCGEFDQCEGDDASGDRDGDAWCDDLDNCAAIYNPGQEDVVAPSGVGDVCVVVFVDASAAPGGDGTSWPKAFRTLQQAADAVAEDGPTGPRRQAWVAAGTYRASNNGAAVVDMSDGLEIYGGFHGDEVSFEQRPSQLELTVIDGDRLGNDVPLSLDTVNEERNAPNQPSRSDNSAQVVVMGSKTRLDGVTIQGGYTTAVQEGVAVIVPVNTLDVYLHNVIISKNIGAVFNASAVGLVVNNGAAVHVTDSTISDNIGWNGAGIRMLGGTLSLDNVDILRNGAIGGQGPGLTQSGGALTVVDTRFIGNELRGNGGCGFLAGAGTSTFVNVLFDGNLGRRGAIQVSGGARTFYNLTVANTSLGGGGFMGEGAVLADANSSFYNTVFWNNDDGDLRSNGADWPGLISHSCAATDLGLYGALGNVLLDQSVSELGNPFSVGPSEELFLSNAAAGDAVTSACVDSGDVSSGNPDVYFPDWSSTTTRRDGVLDGAALSPVGSDAGGGADGGDAGGAVSGDTIDMGYHYAP